MQRACLLRLPMGHAVVCGGGGGGGGGGGQLRASTRRCTYLACGGRLAFKASSDRVRAMPVATGRTVTSPISEQDNERSHIGARSYIINFDSCH